jgi:hypothetical protein
VLTASAGGNFPIARVEFYDGPTFRGQDFSAPYNFNWDVTDAANGSHFWTVRAVDSNGNTITSSSVQLNVNISAPQIIVAPLSQIVFAKTNLQLSAAGQGSLPLHYQWLFNGKKINRATNSTLSLNNIKANKSGNYTVAVTNAYGAVTSAPAHLQVVVPATIMRPPASKMVRAGTKKFRLAVKAGGTKPLSYQWFFGASLIPNATNSSLFLTNLQVTQSGVYTVVVANIGRTVRTNATLTVTPVLTSAILAAGLAAPAPAGVRLYIERTSTGRVNLIIDGVAMPCDLQQSADFIHWETIRTLVPEDGANRRFELPESAAPQMFYRVSAASER